MFSIPIDPIFAEENVLTDFTSPFYLDAIADGKVIYGKDVLDKTAFEQYNISTITTGGARIGWRVSA